MYAQLVMLTLGPGMRSTAEKLADQLAPAVRALKGFKSETFLGDETVGEYWCLSLWESKEDAEAATAAIGPRVDEAMSAIGKGPVTRRSFEVYEPKA